MTWAWHGFFSEDLPFKNCKWLSLSQTYLRFFMIFTRVSTHTVIVLKGSEWTIIDTRSI